MNQRSIESLVKYKDQAKEYYETNLDKFLNNIFNKYFGTFFVQFFSINPNPQIELKK